MIIGIMIFAELYNHVNAKFWSGTLIWYWVFSLACYSALSIFWDIVYDWNLRVEEWILRGLPTFPTWLFPPHGRWIYYLIVVADAALRAAWGFRISNYSSAPLNFGLSFAEFGRRMIWIPLRIDDELRRRNILPPPPEQEMGELGHQA
ncbi:hypothetical protein MKW92_037975 [Papaver armeniacum]|nr:hypothetical protein MKW92_037975 [Papaver armeniacum]